MLLSLLIAAMAGPALALNAPAAALASQIEPQLTSWQQLEAAGFEPTRVLPRGGLEQVGASGDLVVQMELLLTRPGVVELIREWRESLQSPERTREFAARRVGKIRALALDAGEAAALRDLLTDHSLRSPTWQPDEDDAADGFHFGAAVDRMKLSHDAWRPARGSPMLQQGATLFAADVQAIKDAENDYGRYMDHVGNSYEAIHPMPGSHRVGNDAEGRPYSSLEVYWRCDLPFPFGDYECDLWVLNRLDDEHRLVTDVYSTSSDFYWLAGRDTFLPVQSNDGQWVATLVVRSFGFDLKNVPDGDAQRRTGIRGGLGNLKLRAEAAFAAKGSKHGKVERSLSELSVRRAINVSERR